MPWGAEDEEQEPIAGHGSETRVVTLSYSTGFFTFVTLEPTRTFWAEGEQVKIHYKVKNTGTVASKATIKVYDDATGNLICTWSISTLKPWSLLEPWTFDAPEATDYRLKMPAHDWTLRFDLAP